MTNFFPHGFSGSFLSRYQLWVTSVLVKFLGLFFAAVAQLPMQGCFCLQSQSSGFQGAWPSVTPLEQLHQAAGAALSSKCFILTVALFFRKVLEISGSLTDVMPLFRWEFYRWKQTCEVQPKRCLKLLSQEVNAKFSVYFLFCINYNTEVVSGSLRTAL